MTLSVRNDGSFYANFRLQIIGNENAVATVYQPNDHVPTIGYGYTFIRLGRDALGNPTWALYENLNSDMAAIGRTLTTSQLTTLNQIVQARNSGQNATADTLITQFSTQFGAITINGGGDADTLFQREVDQQGLYIRAQFRSVLGIAAGTALYNGLNNTVEKRALLDIAYFRGAGNINANLIRALNNQDRAEAWFEIRYNELPTNPASGHSLRLYRDADLFGLYDTAGNANVISTADESKQTYKMLTAHRNVINAYETAHPHPVDGQSLTDALQPARDAFIDWVNSTNLLTGQSSLVANNWNPAAIYYNPNVTTLDARGDDGKANNLERSLLVGSNGADVIWAGAGDDILIGGTGNDSLYGGAGNDTYVFKSGDGVDTIKGDDNDGKLVVDGITLSGSGAKSWINLASPLSPAWSVQQGGKTFNYTLVDPTYVTVNGVTTYTGTLWIQQQGATDKVVVENFSSGDLGLNLAIEPKSVLLFGANAAANVWTDPNYMPSSQTLSLKEGAAQILDWFASMAVPEGGRLQLSSNNAAAMAPMRVIDGANELSFDANGVLTLNLRAGQNSAIFSLLSRGDLNTDQNFTLTATLLDAQGQPIGSTSSLNVAFDATTSVSSSNADEHYWYSEVAVPIDENFATWSYSVVGSGPLGILASSRYETYNFSTAASDRQLTEPAAYFSEYVDRTTINPAIPHPALGFTSDHVGTVGGLGDSYIDGSAYRDVMMDGVNDNFHYDGYVYENGAWHVASLPGSLYGNDNDVLIGGLGDDLLFTHGGNDQAEGGDGNDVIIDRAIADSSPRSYSDHTWFDTADNSNNDHLSGGAGNDIIIAGGGTALLEGGDGADELYAGQDDDTLLGGDGDDVLWGDGQQARMDVDTGTGPLGYTDAWSNYNGWLLGWVQPALADPNVKAYNWGTTLTDVLTGTTTTYQWQGIVEATTYTGKDFLDGGNGNDELRGGGNNDVLYGGAGNDLLIGDDAAHEDTAGDDYLNGEDGNDTLYGEAGADTLIGGAGDDQLMGDGLTTTAAKQGNDFLDGGSGNDTLWGNGGADTLLGGDGNDYLEGDYSTTPTSAQGNDYLDGGAGDDTLLGDGGADTLVGGAGIDQLIGGAGTDTLSGGDGDDYLEGDSSSTAASDQGNDYLDGGAGNDVLIGDGGADTLLGGAGDDQLDGDSSATSLSVQGDDYLDGGDGNDVLFGWGGNDTLIGGSGNDSFSGGDGDDILNGGEGNDVIYGGAGNDTIYAGAGTDYLSGDAGNDTYIFSAADLLPINNVVDSVVDTHGSNTIIITDGFTLDEVVIANVNESSLQISNMAGDVALSVSNATIQFQFSDGETIDASRLVAERYADALNINSTAESAFLLGGAAGDVITGTGANANLSGGLGNDQLTGSASQSTTFLYSRGDGADVIVDQSQQAADGTGPLNMLVLADVNLSDLKIQDQDGKRFLIVNDQGGSIQVGTNTAAIYDSRILDSIQFADGSVRTWAEVVAALGVDVIGADTETPQLINGTVANDRIVGSSGNDTISGGTGNDSLLGGTGDDTYLVGIGDGADVVDDAAGSNDVLRFGAGILPTDLTLIQSGSVLTVQIGAVANGNSVSIVTPSNGQVQPIERFEFDNGTVWNVTQIDDHISIGNRKPRISNAIEDQAALVEQAFTFTIPANAFIDPNVSDTLGFTVTQVDGSPLPSWLQFNAQTRTFSGTRPSFDSNVYSLKVVATDVGGLYASDNFDVTVRAHQHIGTSGADTLQGTALDDVLEGRAGNDVLIGGDGNDELHGEAGHDDLQGGAGNDILIANEGEDTLTGGAGDDRLDGGRGADRYVFSNNFGNDLIVDAGGFDRLEFSPDSGITLANLAVARQGDNLIVGNGGNTITIQGAIDELGWYRPAIDEFVFYEAGIAKTYSSNQIVGMASGTDTAPYTPYIDTQFNNLFLTPGDALNFQIPGNAFTDVESQSTLTYSIDWFYGQPSWLTFNPLTRTLSGTAPTDATTVYGLSVTATDSLGQVGYSPRFNLVVIPGLVYTDATAASDVISGGASSEYIRGFAGNDTLSGNGGQNVLDGGDGNDTIYIGPDGDYVFGGNGNDYIYQLSTSSTPNSVDVHGGSGDDHIEVVGSGIMAYGDSGDDYISGSSQADGGEGDDHLIGKDVTTQFGDSLYGGSGNDLIEGLAGDDQLGGDAGDDTLLGGSGNDYLTGDVGNDVYNGGSGNDKLRDLYRTGNDKYVGFNGTSGADEIIDYGGDDVIEFDSSANLRIDQLAFSRVNSTSPSSSTKNDLRITVNSSSNKIDIIDWYRVVQGGGTWGVIENLFLYNAGLRYRYSSSQIEALLAGVNSGPVVNQGEVGQVAAIGQAFSLQLAPNLFSDIESQYSLQYSAMLVNGSPLPSWLTFNSTTRTFSGTPTGADSGVISVRISALDAGGLSSTFDLPIGVGAAQVLGAAGDDVLSGTGAQDFIYGRDGNDFLAGADGNDFLYGEAGDDVLQGGAGADTLAGGAGNDIYLVDDLLDVIVEQAASGTDEVRATVSYALGSNVENLTLLGSNSINGTGNELANILTGNDAANTLDGGLGADQLRGGAGNDIYIIDNVGDTVMEDANGGIDTAQASISWNLSANVENLTLVGSSSINATGNADANVLTGNASNNTLDGGLGADSLSGGAGDDIYLVDNVGDQVIELVGEGTDEVRASVSYSLAANVEKLTLIGSQTINGTGNSLANTITGNAAANVLDGGAGNDSLVGGLGDDTYIVDSTLDTITESSNQGTDTVQSTVTWTLGSNLENLTLVGTSAINGTGNSLVNVITGNSANNTLSGGSGADTMIGGAGNDTYVVDNTGDVVIENASEGTDLIQASVTYTLSANVENLTLTGTTAINATGNTLDNVLTGNSGVNTLTGGVGNDTLDGSTGADTLIGGTGNDTYVVDNTGDVVTENANEGTDLVQSSITYTLGANVENLTLTGSSALNGTGNTLANLLTGNSGNNTLDGGTGADTMVGGAGNDTYVVDNIGDVVTENASEGTDLVQSSLTYTLANNVENLTLTSTGAINGVGNALANTLTGNSSDNVLDGGAGADTLIGGAGNDTYVVDNTADVITEAASAGTDLVQSSVTYTLATNIENITLTGTATINGTGNALANVLTGNSANNVLDGGTGADTMLGGSGNDTYVVDNASDVVTENTSEGTDLVQSSITYTLGNNVENLILTGTNAINATGNTLDNILTGNTVNNTLTGGAGNDTLDGGAGTDTMIGGTGNDIYYVDATTDVTTEAANEGIDTVNSSVTLTLAANIELLFQTGSTAINGTGNALANLLRGNTANNTLASAGGTDILEGGAGNDTLSNTSDNTLLNGGAGTDTLTGTANNDLLIGGTGNDALTTGQGADIIAFNKGDGQDTVAVSTTKDNTLSIGGGTNYADMLFQKSGNNLILKVGASDQITFTNYYANTANRSVNKLQVVLEGSTDYNAGSSNAMYNKKIETFDFGGLVAAFDAALVANPSLTSWSLSNALLSQYLTGSDTAALGGDLAYQYGRFGNETNLSFTPALGILSSASFGTATQTLQSLASLQDGSPRLS